MRKIIAAVAVACAFGAYAEERTVSDAAGLVEALLALNSGTDTGNVIYLEPGNYDVSPYAMKRWDRTAIRTDTVSHIALAHVKITGKTANPRDTVIYCNGTNRVIHSQISRVECLTVSNGFSSVGTTGGAGVLSVNASSDSQKSFHSNVVVTCCTSGGAGGGVYYGTWYDSVIISNRMTDAGSGGGGVAGATCYNCEISNNESLGTGGAGFYIATFYDCIITNNRASLSGGGLQGGSCTNYAGLIAGNYAVGNGGGVYNAVILDGTILSNNVSGACGGGAYYTSRDSQSSNITVCCNHSTDNGGGVYGGTWRDCDIYGNVTVKYGGGVCNANCHSCDIHGNSSANFGGGVYYTANLHDCRVFGNSSSKNGGGVSGNGETSGFCHIYGGVISNNTAGTDGGGVHSCILHGGTTVCGNLAERNGGGVYNTEGAVATNTVVCCNEAHGSNSGGMCIYRGWAIGCVISNNFLMSNVDGQAQGGGSYVGGSARDCKFVFNRLSNDSTHKDARAYGGGTYSGVLSNCVIAGNAIINCGTATRQGGGCYSSTLTNCVVVDNFAYGGLGVGIQSGSAYGCVISNNASSSADGTQIRDANPLVNCDLCASLTSPRAMYGCRITGFTNGVNIAAGRNVYTNGWFHGSKYLCDGWGYMTNCLFAGNVSNESMFRSTSTTGLWLSNCTIADNKALRIFHNATMEKGYLANAVNCIFVGNTWNGSARNMWYDNGQTNITLRNCLIGSGRQSKPVLSEENTITNNNPKFVKDGSRDAYALKRSSPAVGKGLVQDWMADALDIRQDAAFPRLRDGKVDIGCYQCWLNPIGLYFSIR